MVKSYNLKPGGDKIPVTKQNRKGESTLQSPLAVTHLQGNRYSHWHSKSILYLYEPASLTAVQYLYLYLRMNCTAKLNCAADDTHLLKYETENQTAKH